MIKYFLVIVTLMIGKDVFSQTGIGVNTLQPTEGFDVNRTLRIRELPKHAQNNVISTFADGSPSQQKDQPFIATNTVVADANGVLGIIEGLPTVEIPEIKSIAYTAKTAVIDNNVRTNSLITIGNIALYFDARSGDTGRRPVRFCLLNGIQDNVIVNQMKLGAGGGTYGKNQSYFSVRSNNTTPLANTIPAYDSSDETYWHKITAEEPDIGNKDYIQYMISLINTREIYRLTAIVNGSISGSGTVTSQSTVTFFIERLTNQ